MSSEAIVIALRDVSKHYLMFDRPDDRLRQMIVPRLQRIFGREPKRYYRDFAALRHVSLEVRRGETVGVVGRNGSGKSTLLQIICGILRPSSGTVNVNGRVAALLELGSGFNPDFTGRENVYLNAAILGLQRVEIEQRFDSIAAFADIGAFIDQPLKTYSSGMYLRLAFATAINVDPDILIVDEALAVGDEAFQRKCFSRIEQIKERGGTVLLVTHNSHSVVQLCSRAILMDAGEAILDGSPKAVTIHYHRLIGASTAAAPALRAEIIATRGALNAGSEEAGMSATTDSSALSSRSTIVPRDDLFDPNLRSETRSEYVPRGARISRVRILDTDLIERNMLSPRGRYCISYEVTFDRKATSVGMGFLLKTPAGLEIAGVGTSLSRKLLIDAVEPAETVDVSFWFDCALTPGTFFLQVGCLGVIDGEQVYLHRISDAYLFKVLPETDAIATGYLDLAVRPDIRRRKAVGSSR